MPYAGSLSSRTKFGHGSSQVHSHIVCTSMDLTARPCRSDKWLECQC